MDSYKFLDGFEIQQDRICLVKIPYTYNGRIVVSTLVRSFLDESSSFLQVTRTTIKAWMILKFCHSPPPTTEVDAFECRHLKFVKIGLGAAGLALLGRL